MTGNGEILNSQDWALAAGSGERLEVHITYQQTPGARPPASEVRFYSAKNPTFFQISKQEQVLDILRNTTTSPPEPVKKLSFNGGCGSYAKLFDGTQKLLSWDNIIWINRTVSVP